jgi:hypothetical protein
LRYYPGICPEGPRKTSVRTVSEPADIPTVIPPLQVRLVTFLVNLLRGTIEAARAGIAQSVLRWTVGWAAGVRFPQERDCCLHSVQTGSGSHPASYPLGTAGFFLGNKAVGV